MPRIAAATVAEHIAQRRADVVAAAVTVLQTGGPSAVTPAAVASRAGMARSTLYQYFPSSGALLGAAVEELFARLSARLTEALRDAGSPSDRLDAYIRATLQAAVDGHGPNAALAETDMPDHCREHVRRLHEGTVEPLLRLLDEAGCQQVSPTAGLIGGVLSAAAAQITRGADLDATCALASAFIAGAVGLGRG